MKKRCGACVRLCLCALFASHTRSHLPGGSLSHNSPTGWCQSGWKENDRKTREIHNYNDVRSLCRTRRETIRENLYEVQREKKRGDKKMDDSIHRHLGDKVKICTARSLLRWVSCASVCAPMMFDLLFTSAITETFTSLSLSFLKCFISFLFLGVPSSRFFTSSRCLLVSSSICAFIRFFKFYFTEKKFYSSTDSMNVRAPDLWD